MKTKEEIKLEFFKKFDNEQCNSILDFFENYNGISISVIMGKLKSNIGFIKGDMVDEIVNFHEWIRLSKPSELKYVGNVNGKCYYYKGEYYTTKELYIIYNSLNKTR
jgi:hypothetical protein